MSIEIEGGKLVKLSNPGEILFFVPDVRKAQAWYSDLLDAPLIVEDDGYCSFLVDTTRVGLHPADAKSPSGAGGEVAYWRVQHLQEAVVYFEDHGCQMYRGPICGIDGIYVCQMKDPFGNVWGLMEQEQPHDPALRLGDPQPHFAAWQGALKLWTMRGSTVRGIPDGATLIVDTTWPGQPSRGDVIIFRSPVVLNTWWVSVVAQTPGEEASAEFRMKFPQQEPTVPPGCYVVRGTANAFDSLRFGYLRRELVRGVAIAVMAK